MKSGKLRALATTSDRPMKELPGLPMLAAAFKNDLGTPGGWLATAANTPAQFRSRATALGLDELCTDPRALDLDAFNAPNGGFVVAKDLDYLRARFREAFATRSASEMETALNAIGVPAARVRTLKEFLAGSPRARDPADLRSAR